MTPPVWRLSTTTRFDREFAKLDSTVQRRIAAELEAMIRLPDPRTRGKSLTGDLHGYWRYRFGDYRVIVDIRDGELCIIALTVGHRSKVYR